MLGICGCFSRNELGSFVVRAQGDPLFSIRLLLLLLCVCVRALCITIYAAKGCTQTDQLDKRTMANALSNAACNSIRVWPTAHTHIQLQSHLYTHTQLHTLNGYEISGTWGNQGHCRSVDCKLCPKDNKDGTNRKALMQLHTHTQAFPRSAGINICK